MEIPGITWRGKEITDSDILTTVPPALKSLLKEVNGFILHHGVLHIRGACETPEWHSLREAWLGEQAFDGLYEEVLPTDIPFAQDQLGDQFLLRDGKVMRLFAETGEIEPFADSLEKFLAGLRGDIQEFLDVGFNRKTQPGQLLRAYPPFCMEEAEKGVTLTAGVAIDVILFHADLAEDLRNIPEGGAVELDEED